MEPTYPIAEAAQQCIEALTGCLEVPALMENEWAENRLADMNLWISGTGACASGRASLDSRLATRPEAHSVITNLLRLLGTLINQTREQSQNRVIFNPSEESSSQPPQDTFIRAFSPWSDDSSSDTQSDDINELNLPVSNPLRESIYNIESMIDQLARIGVAIRRSGRRSRLQKADQRFKESEHQELEEHLNVILLILLKESPQRLDPSVLSEVQLRLIRCNLKRRNRFIYAQKHSRGLDSDVMRLGKEDPAVAQANLVDGMTGAARNPDASKIGTHHPNQTIKTGTTASLLSDSFVVPQADPLPSASSIMSSTMIDLEYPRPPRFKKNAHIFRCPCCCEALPVAIADRNRWRKHVAADLSPYTCILPGCDEPEVLFSTKETWQQHLLKDHSSRDYWVCFACGDGTQFHSEYTFIEYSKSKHATSIPKDQTRALIELSKRSTPTAIRRCPLCHWPEDDDVEVGKEVLLNHIAKELHSFSLRALPWANENEQKSNGRIRSSSEKVREWLELQEDHDQGVHVCAEKICISEYFQENPYFAGSSRASSSSDLSSEESRALELEYLTEVEGSMSHEASERDSLGLKSHTADTGDHHNQVEAQSSRSLSPQSDIYEDRQSVASSVPMRIPQNASGSSEINRDQEVERSSYVSDDVHKVDEDNLSRWEEAQQQVMETRTTELGRIPETTSPNPPEAPNSPVDSTNATTGSQTAPIDAVEDHWIRNVFSSYDTETPLPASEERAGIFAKPRQGVKEVLQEEGYECLLQLAFNDDSMMTVYFYLRKKDHRARLVCKIPHRTRPSEYFCLPLNLLEVIRKGSCLQLCRRGNNGKELILWARLQFKTIESMVTFFVTFLALRAQDAGRPVDDILDYELKEEEEFFGGLIIDDGYPHALRVYHDRISGAVRIQAAVHKGEMDRTPVWTAFVTHCLHKRGWLKLVDNRTVVVRDLKLIILMLAKDYNPPMTSRGEHTLKFSTRNDAKDFLEVMEELAIKIVPNSLPPKTASAAEDAGQGLVVTDG